MNFSGCKKSDVWVAKMQGVADRAFNAYQKDCSFFDPNVEHGGPEPESDRKRRDADDLRYSSTDAIGSINAVTGGLKKVFSHFNLNASPDF